MLRKLRENRKKGFTLVELIVVLVILAILAALLIPALTGYIDKAKNKQIIAETRQAVMAAQTLIDEAYATKDVGTDVTVSETSNDVSWAEIEKLAEVGSGTVKGVKVGKVEIETTGTGSNVKGATYRIRVEELVYNAHGKWCKYNAAATGDKYEVSADTLSITN